jgi:hypothetical protein
MTRPLTEPAAREPLNLLIARVAQELSDLLSDKEVDHRARESADKSGVLTAAVEALQGLIANMRTDLYVTAGLIPQTHLPARQLAPGWGTVLQIVEENALRKSSVPPTALELAYHEGACHAAARIKDSIPAAGADKGGEPLMLQIARKAIELQSLLDQVGMPSDWQPGGGVLALAKFSMDGVARNMNEGLYISFGILPKVKNPAYLPTKQWKQLLEDIRRPSVEAVDKETDPVKYQYHEGVRWTCAKFRSAFRNLSEPAQYY